MADAIVSMLLDRLAALVEDQARNEVNLVRGVENEILDLSYELKTVRNVLDDAEKKGYKDKNVKDWLDRLERTAYEMDDVLDEWNMAILKFRIQQSNNAASKKKVWSFISTSCICFKKIFAIRRHIVLKIKEVKARLDLILVEKDLYGFVISRSVNPSCESWRVQSTSLVDLEEICGRDVERENLVSKLVVEGGSTGEELGIQILYVVGVAGLGKTALAKLAYNDSRVKNCFQLRIWICVSDTFDEIGLATRIIEGAGGRKPKTNQSEIVLQCLKDTISEKSFLLVLDDVWIEDRTKWETLKNCLQDGGPGSKILVTTRNKRVAIMMGAVKNEIHHLGHLSHDNCWLLLGRIALSGKYTENCGMFENIGKNIAKKCKGLPLAAKTLGSLLHFKNTFEEWENLLTNEIWELEEEEVELFPHLILSYNELSPSLKCCFSYCSVFPKGTEIDVEKLITKWMAMGYLGYNGDWKLRGREYFDKLVMRSLFQDFEKGIGYDYELIKSFKMHDIIHDFAQFLRKKNGGLMKQTTCQTCSPLIVSHVKQYRSLFHQKELPDPHLCDRLTSLRLLSLRKCGLQSIPKEIEVLIHLRWLDLGCNKFPDEDLKTICKLYNLQFLWVDECELQEIPREIGNLIKLIHLDMSSNKRVKELPEMLCNLRELESLNIDSCESLAHLPRGVHRLVNLKYIYNSGTDSLQYPQGLARLTGLVTLSRFGGKLGWLKNLNRLSGSLKLTIELSGDSEEEVVVEDAREAELAKKTRIQELTIYFSDSCKAKESVWMDLIDALEPHQNMQTLSIQDYKGSQLPRWISSPFNQLKSITIVHCKLIFSMPPLGKLPLLENVTIWNNSQLEFVGREFLGMTTNSGDRVVGFPKLKKLAFWNCTKWNKWEDITAEEEEDCVAVILMPRLTELLIINCECLTELPHRLLRKASASLKLLNIHCSTQLKRFYANKEGLPWKSISRHNPHLELRHH
ncbi:hypothetical protein ABFS82_14G197200 [Erythranthe guttata]|uniref:putative disease resistance protein RGA4 n=1 Tax=Erythranthe guttata TaxID=4155 RepID=UPI00064DD6C3|nr:PREDICTED: putative disease resistance protein RGA4 [Erythranthe guttata]|eukprot:XP_012836608.1 PREDICTED: putative disease resistance protein RGA4 [Erythranthe guttata]